MLALMDLGTTAGDKDWARTVGDTKRKFIKVNVKTMQKHMIFNHALVILGALTPGLIISRCPNTIHRTK